MDYARSIQKIFKTGIVTEPLGPDEAEILQLVNK